MFTAMKDKAFKMHDVIDEMEEKRNYSNVEAEKKLGMCKKENWMLLADNSLLQKKAKNLTLHLGDIIKVQLKERLLIQQLQWLHKKNGAFALLLINSNLFSLKKNRIH